MQALQQVYELYKNGAGICTDTRKLQSGDIFFALKGPNFNGNLFAAKAIDAGAVVAIIDEEVEGEKDKLVQVDNVLSFLQELGRHHRRQFDIPVIAIAGSNGKTTTKELIRSVLESTFKTFATPGNFNNEIGVPLALLMMKPDTEAAVIEMGARHVGEIAELCEIAEPNMGLVTNIGRDHMETFGSIENTRKTNTELYKYLADTDGLVLVNTAHKDLMAEAQVADRVILFGTHEADVIGRVGEAFPYLKLTVEGSEGEFDIQTQLVGKYNFENVMAAVTVGQVLEMPDQLIRKSIESYVPSNNRSQLTMSGSNIFILDAYNANPSSMEEALKNFEELQPNNFSKKVVILGDMLELGPTSLQEHVLVTNKLQDMNLDMVILVGQEFGCVKSNITCQHFNTAEEAQTWFKTQDFQDTLFLLKGSRGIALEKVIA